jgi:hypothetical protein
LAFDSIQPKKLLDEMIDSTSFKLSFDFIGNAVFSEMYPHPDEKDMSSITFTDTEKVKYIIHNGLLFHVELSDNKNIQTARIFFLTTILSMLIAYWLTLVAKVFKHYYDKLEKEHDAEGNNDRLSSLDEK